LSRHASLASVGGAPAPRHAPVLASSGGAPVPRHAPTKKAFVPRAPVVESKSGSMMIRVQGPKLAAHVEKATCARRTDIPVLRCGDSTRVAMTSSLARVFKIEASQGQTLSMDTCGAAATFDTVMEVYQGCPREIAFTSQVGEGYALANDDGVCPDGPSDASRLSGVVQLAGQELYVRVRGFAGHFGDFELHLACDDSPSPSPSLASPSPPQYSPQPPPSSPGFWLDSPSPSPNPSPDSPSPSPHFSPNPSPSQLSHPPDLRTPASCATPVKQTLSCGGEAIATVDMQFEGDWYLLDAPADALVQIDTCRDSTDVDTMLEVYTGCPEDGGDYLMANDDAYSCAAFGRASWLNAVQMPAAGTPTYVKVRTWGSQEGAYSLRLGCPEATACTPSPNVRPLACGDVWSGTIGEHESELFALDVPEGSSWTVSTCGGNTDMDTVLEAHLGCASRENAPIFPNDDFCAGGGSTITSGDLQAVSDWRPDVPFGSAVYVLLSGYGGVVSGSVDLKLTCADPARADDDVPEFATASVGDIDVSDVTCESARTGVLSCGETISGSFGPQQSALFKIDAPAGVPFTVDTCQTEVTDTVLELFNECTPAVAALVGSGLADWGYARADDDSCSDVGVPFTSRLTVSAEEAAGGSDMHVRVRAWGGNGLLGAGAPYTVTLNCGSDIHVPVPLGAELKTECDEEESATPLFCNETVGGSLGGAGDEIFFSLKLQPVQIIIIITMKIIVILIIMMMIITTATIMTTLTSKE